MVLQDNRSPLSKSLLHIPRLDLDASRIVGVSGALLLNLAVLGLLLVPAALPQRAMQRDIPTLVVQQLPEKVERTIVETTVKPIPHEREQDPRPITPPTVQPTPVEPMVDQSVVVDQGALPALPSIDTGAPATAVEIAPPSGPVAGIALRYLSAEAPPYPRDALRAGIEGTVMLKVLVDIDGRPIAVDIHRSSGSRKLDDAARRFVLANWRFEPAMQDGRAVQATGIVPIDFNLGR